MTGNARHQSKTTANLTICHHNSWSARRENAFHSPHFFVTDVAGLSAWELRAIAGCYCFFCPVRLIRLTRSHLPVDARDAAIQPLRSALGVGHLTKNGEQKIAHHLKKGISMQKKIFDALDLLPSLAYGLLLLTLGYWLFVLCKNLLAGNAVFNLVSRIFWVGLKRTWGVH